MKNIIAAVDFSDVTPAVIEKAVCMAQKFGARLYIIHTEPPELEYVAYGLEQAYAHIDTDITSAQNRNLLEELEKTASTKGIEVESILMKGPTSEMIINEVENVSADLVILGTHEHGAFYHLFFGSTRDNVIKQAHVPVMVVPPVHSMAEA
ncbi:MAG: universal stress protein [Planctomycetota bacterium]